jgi:hypothetical protein
MYANAGSDKRASLIQAAGINLFPFSFIQSQSKDLRFHDTQPNDT